MPQTLDFDQQLSAFGLPDTSSLAAPDDFDSQLESFGVPGGYNFQPGIEYERQRKSDLADSEIALGTIAGLAREKAIARPYSGGLRDKQFTGQDEAEKEFGILHPQKQFDSKEYDKQHRLYSLAHKYLSAGVNADSTLTTEIADLPARDKDRFLAVLQDVSQTLPPKPTGFLQTLKNVLPRVARGLESIAPNIESYARDMGFGDESARNENEFQAKARAIQHGYNSLSGTPTTARPSLPGKALALAEQGLVGAAEMAPPMAASFAVPGRAGGIGFWITQTEPGLRRDLEGMGFDKDASAEIASVASLPIAAIEQMQAGMLVPGGAKKMLPKWILAEASRKSTRALKPFIAQKVKEGAIVYGVEWGEEVAQEAMELAAKAYVDHVDDKMQLSGDDWVKQFGHSKDELVQAAVSLPFLMGPGMVANAGAEGLQARSEGQRRAGELPLAKARREFRQRNDELVRDYSLQGDSVVQWVAANPAKAAQLAALDTPSRSQWSEFGPSRLKADADYRSKFAATVKAHLATQEEAPAELPPEPAPQAPESTLPASEPEAAPEAEAAPAGQPAAPAVQLTPELQPYQNKQGTVEELLGEARAQGGSVAEVLGKPATSESPAARLTFLNEQTNEAYNRNAPQSEIDRLQDEIARVEKERDARPVAAKSEKPLWPEGSKLPPVGTLVRWGNIEGTLEEPAYTGSGAVIVKMRVTKSPNGLADGKVVSIEPREATIRNAQPVAEPVRAEEPKSESVAESLDKAGRSVEERRKKYRDLTAKLPDGTVIAGWTKTTTAGDVFWVNKSGKGTPDVLVEVGQSAVDKALSKPAPSKGVESGEMREITAKDVGEILARHENNVEAKRSADDMREKWVSSDTFVEMEVPLDMVTPATKVAEGAKSYTQGPVIVDVNKTSAGRFEGRYGAPAKYLILDGKHRHAEAVAEGKTTITMLVGDKAVPGITEEIAKRAEQRREAEVEAAKFLDPNNKSPGSSLMRLRHLLPEAEVDALRQKRKDAINAPKPAPSKGLKPEVAYLRSRLPNAKPVGKAKLSPADKKESDLLDSFGVKHTFFSDESESEAFTNKETKHVYIKTDIKDKPGAAKGSRRRQVVGDELMHGVGLDMNSVAFTEQEIAAAEQIYISLHENNPGGSKGYAEFLRDPKNKDQLRREAKAHLGSEILRNESFRAELEKEQPSLLQRIIDAIFAIFEVRTQAELTDSEKTLLKELRAARERMGKVADKKESPNNNPLAEMEELAKSLGKDLDGVFFAAPAWRSNTLDALDAWPQSKGSAQQIRAHLEKFKGAMDEAKWIGLDDYLKRGKATYTKQELREFVEKNQVEVKEVELGRPELPYGVEIVPIEKHESAYANGWRFKAKSSDGIQIRNGVGITADEVFKNVAVSKGHKFSQYVIPGGENYRELLLTLPVVGREAWGDVGEGPFATQEEAEGFAESEVGAKYRVAERDGKWIIETMLEDDMRGSGNFISSHFDEPNILAHVRFNERTDAAGKRVLFIEEVQSDWHQKGKKSGYKTPTRLIDGKDYDYWSRQVDALFGQHDKKVEWQQAAQNRDALAGKPNEVPDAPFKQTWPILAMKRMIRYASEQGFDALSWTTGEQQAARYDLSKQVDHIDYNRQSDGKYKLAVVGKDGEDIIYGKEYAAEELEDVVGKEIAAKIVAGEGKPGGGRMTLSGIDLKIGGEGMKGFYDKILPAEVNKFVKKFGGKVEAGSVRTKHSLNPIRNGEDGSWLIYDPITEDTVSADAMGVGNSTNSLEFETENEAIAFIKSRGKSGGLPIHSLPITPSMRETAVEKGFPLFAAPSQEATREEKAQQIAQRAADGGMRKYAEFEAFILPKLGGDSLATRELLAKSWNNVRTAWNAGHPKDTMDEAKTAMPETPLEDIPVKEVRKALKKRGINIWMKADNNLERWYVGSQKKKVKGEGDTHSNNYRAIKELGGQWDGAEQAHYFPSDPTYQLGRRFGDVRIRAEYSNSRVNHLANWRERPRFRGADRRRDSGYYQQLVGVDTQALINRGAKLKTPIAADVLKDQIEDIGRGVTAFADGLPLFMTASDPGGGKTFVLGGIIRELLKRGESKIVYVTTSRKLIAQVKKDLKDYGVNHVEFRTYTEIRRVPGDTRDQVVILDEAHNVKNLKSEQGRGGKEMIKHAKFTVISSATPFENPIQAEYLKTTGIFDEMRTLVDHPQRDGTVDRVELRGFQAWAYGHGASLTVSGKGNNLKTTVAWVGGRDKQMRQMMARDWFITQGLFTQRDTKFPPGMVNSPMFRVEVSEEYQRLYAGVQRAYAQAKVRYSKFTGEIAMHEAGVLKRILEASKVDKAIERAKAHILAGRQVVVFTETKADREIGVYRESGSKIGSKHYTYPEISERMRAWRSAVAAAKRSGVPKEQWPKRPFSRAVEAIAQVTHENQIRFSLPSVPDSIRKALPANRVSEYRGGMTDKRANYELQAWLDGKTDILISTMDKGGTGLSLHDTTGTKRPRAQIGINIPWTATKTKQVGGRVARQGVAKPVEVEWLFAGNIPFEMRAAQRVGQRMQDMGAIVSGISVRAGERLEEFDLAEEHDVLDTDEALGDSYEQEQTDYMPREQAAEYEQYLGKAMDMMNESIARENAMIDSMITKITGGDLVAKAELTKKIKADKLGDADSIKGFDVVARSVRLEFAPKETFTDEGVDDTDSDSLFALLVRGKRPLFKRSDPEVEAVAQQMLAPAEDGGFDFEAEARRNSEEQGDMLFAAPAEQWRSNSLDAIDSWPQSKGSAQQVLAHLAKTQGAMDEAKFIGLDDYLKRGKASYTKQELQDFVREHRVEVQEVELGRPNLSEPEPEYDPQGDYHFFVVRDRDTGRVIGEGGTPQAAKDDANAEMRGTEDKTHFSQYVLPGGENYRERFVTLPNVTRQSAEDRWEVMNPVTGETIEWVASEEIAKRRAEELKMDYSGPYVKGAALEHGGWQDGHGQYSDIKNPVVRLRTNERTTSDGKRVLFIEEMQPPSKENQKNMPEWALKRWREIGMKQAIRIAAQEGLDGIAWTPGTVQAERYSLEKQVDKIHVTPRTNAETGEKSRSVAVELKGGSVVRFGVDNNGVIDNTSGSQEMGDAKGKPLADVIGKDMAERVMKLDRQVLEGVDLKVGGEGLKKAYDSDLPNVANKLAKKFGGKVGTANVEAGEAASQTYVVSERAGYFVEGGLTNRPGPFKTSEEAKAKSDELNNQRIGTPVPTLLLPDSMRESASAGMPLFAAPEDLANPMRDEPGRRNMDAVTQDYIDSLSERRVSDPEVQKAVDAALAANYQGEVEYIRNWTKDSRSPHQDVVQVGIANEIANREWLSALQSGDSARLRAVNDIKLQVRLMRAEHARAMRWMHDPVESPAERRARILGEAISTPHVADSAELDRLRKRIADLEAKLATAGTGTTDDASVELLRKRLSDANAALEQHKAKMALEIEKVLTALKALGYDTADLKRIAADYDTAKEMLSEISAIRGNRGDWFFELWNQALLSGPPTHVANTATSIWRGMTKMLLKLPIEALVLQATEAKEADFNAIEYVASVYKAAIPGMFFAAKIAHQSFMLERPVLSELVHPKTLGAEDAALGDRYGAGNRAVGGRFGKGVRAFGYRALGAEDQFFNAMIGYMLASGQAYRMGKELGKSGEILDRFIEAQVTHLSSPAWVLAHEEASKQTYTQRGGETTQRLKRAVKMAANWGPRKTGGLLRWIVPYHNFFINLMERTLVESPLGVVSLAKSIQHGRKTGEWEGVPEQVAQQISTMLPIMALMALVFMQDDDDPWITGAESEFDKGSRELAKRMNRPAFSIRIGGRNLNYNRLEPLATVLPLVVDTANGIKSGDPIKMFTNPFKSIVGQVKNKSFLAGVGDILKAVESESPEEGLAKYASSFAASWVPNLVKAPIRGLEGDIPERGVWGDGIEWWGKLGKRTVQKTELGTFIVGQEPSYDVWGRNREKGGGPVPGTDWLWRMLSPVEISRTEVLPGDQVIAAWNRLHPEKNWHPGLPHKTWRDSTGTLRYMTDPQWSEYLRISGQTAKQLIDAEPLDTENPTEGNLETVKDTLTVSHKLAKESLVAAWEAGQTTPAEPAIRTLQAKIVERQSESHARRLATSYPLSITKLEKDKGISLRDKQEAWRKELAESVKWMQAHNVSTDRAVRLYKGSGEAKARIRRRLAGNFPK